MRDKTSLFRPLSTQDFGLNFSFTALAVTCAAALVLSGCGGGSVTSKPQISAITFTDANGNKGTATTSFKVGTGSYFDAIVTNDAQSLGINWTVNCSSKLAPGTPLPPGQTVDESCGTFTPVHTATGPVPSFAATGAGVVTFYQAPTAVPSTGTVTVYAATTIDPSIYTSSTFTIVGVPISIGFAPGPPASLETSATAQLGALVSNDSAAGGVSWSVTCGSIACGSFSPAQTASIAKTTYTAPDAVPAGGSVTITATSVTDPTKTAATQVTITQAASASARSIDQTGPGTLLAQLQGENR